MFLALFRYEKQTKKIDYIYESVRHARDRLFAVKDMPNYYPLCVYDLDNSEIVDIYPPFTQLDPQKVRKTILTFVSMEKLKNELKRLNIDIEAFEEELDIKAGTLSKDHWSKETITHVYSELRSVYDVRIEDLEKLLE